MPEHPTENDAGRRDARPPSHGGGTDGDRLALVERFFRGTGPSYDRMVACATLGIDRRWKQDLVDMIPPDAGRILDLACGTGISTLAIAARRPHAEVVGVELREEYLALARAKLRRLGRHKVTLVRGRAEDFHDRRGFDCVASSYLAKYADLPRLTANSHAMLRAGGLLLMHDFTYPPRPLLARLWHLYFWAMQRTVARALPAWREIYEGLPRLIQASAWPQELQVELRRHAFRDVRLRYLTLGGSAIVSARK